MTNIKIKDILINFISLCEAPIGNTITLSKISKIYLDDILESFNDYITEDDNEYSIEIAKNIIKIKK